jgi:hypothetical protein
MILALNAFPAVNAASDVIYKTRVVTVDGLLITHYIGVPAVT